MKFIFNLTTYLLNLHSLKNAAMAKLVDALL